MGKKFNYDPVFVVFCTEFHFYSVAGIYFTGTKKAPESKSRPGPVKSSLKQNYFFWNLMEVS